MTITRHMMIRALMLGASGITLITAATPAFAQLTTATIRGQVTTSAVAAPGAVVDAVNVNTGAASHTTAGPDGSYVLTGLQLEGFGQLGDLLGDAPDHLVEVGILLHRAVDR